MPDSYYQTLPATFKSRGIAARYTDDTLPEGTYLNLDNVEELEENALVSRLGSTIINKTGTAVNALPAPVHSLSRLASYSGSAWRYAGAGTSLYRRTGNTAGPYTSIATGLSGDPWSSVSYRPFLSSFPYLFFADSAQMLKDNGSLASPQQMGIFQPSQPVQALIQAPQEILIDSFENPTGDYTFSGWSGSPALSYRVSTTLTTAVSATGVQTVTVASTTNIAQFQLLDIDSGGAAETVIVLVVTTGGFTADFTKTHLTGAAVSEQYISNSMDASTTATIQRTGSYDLSTFPNGTLTQGADYIAFYLYLDNAANVSEIVFQLDVSATPGAFTDYYSKSIVPSIYQDPITQSTSQTAGNQTDLVTQIIYQEAIGVYTSGAISGYQLNTGTDQWTKILVQMSDFITVGNAGLNTPGFTMADVNAFQLQVTTTSTGGVTVGIDGLYAMGGYGPDSFGGISYDWLYTYYNANTGLESNPSMFMSNVNPPAVTTYITPRRQPVLLTLLPSTDPQVTNIRIYRRGGTLGANFLRVDEIPASSTTYLDISTDAIIEGADIVSLTNDVPVTSTLQVPVNTTLTAALTPAGLGQTLTITPVSMTNISVHQQVTLGNNIDPNQEIVIVESITGTSFTAFVQNPHLLGDPVTAQSIYGQPVNLMALAYNCGWFAGDPNNPHYLYYTNAGNVEALSAAANIEVGTPSDPITAIIPFQGSLFVATRDHWYTIAPTTQTGAAPTVYPTTAVHGVVAPFGWVATESEIWHQSVDGIRSFSGGPAMYRTQEIEFLFQNNGPTPIVEVDPSQFSQTRMAYWNNIVFLSYVGTDTNVHRLMYHTIYKRWRNDDVPATAMFLEPDTNDLLYGDSGGVIHQDRVGSYDEENAAGVVTVTPIALNMQTAYLDQGKPKTQKNYNELTLDANTNGATLTAALLFNDGQVTVPMGTFSTASRQKVNLNVLAGLGQQAYRVSLQVTGSVVEPAILYQADLRGVILAETRQSMDTYWLKQGTDESKICKQAYIEYTAAAVLNCEVYYDLSASPLFTFNLPASNRISTRVRFPAIKYRLIRLVITSTEDFQVWPDSKLEIKPVCSTKGYQAMGLVA